MLYWRELGPQSGQYSINIGVKVSNSLLFFFSLDYFRHVRYMRFAIKRSASGSTFFLHFVARHAANINSCPCRCLSEFHSLTVHAIAVTYTRLRATCAVRNIKFLSYHFFAFQTSFYIILQFYAYLLKVHGNKRFHK